MANGVTIDFNANLTRFVNGIDKAVSDLNRFETNASRVSRNVGSVMSSLGVGLSVAGVAAFAKTGIDAADALNDLSQRTRVSVKTLADWKLAADLSDTSLEALGQGIQRLTLSMGQAEQGGKAQAQALQRLGVTARDPKEAFEQLADAVANSNDPIRTNADLQKVLGKNYAELLPLLQGGAQGLRDSALASASFSEQMALLAPNAAEFNDQIDELQTNAAGAAAALLNQFLPAVNRVFDRFERIGRLRDAGASMSEILLGSALGGVSANLEASLKNVNADIADLESRKKRLGGILSKTDQEELKRLQSVRAEIQAMRAEPLLAPPKSESTPTPPPVADTAAQMACVRDGGTWDGKRCVLKQTENRQPKPQAPIDVFDNGSFVAKDKGVADFIRKQYDAVNELQGAMSGEATRALDDYTSRLNNLISDTPIEKTRVLQENVQLLDDALFDGKISAEQHEQAIESLTGRMQEGLEKNNDLARELGLTFNSAFEDAAVSGKKFGDVLKGLAQDLARLVLRKAVTEPLANEIGGWAAGLFPSANGNVFANAPALSAYSGTVQTSPFVFPFAKGGTFNMGLGAEAGPEGIFPLKRGRDGKLGISAEGAGGVVVQNYYTIDARGADAGVEERIRRAIKESEDSAVNRSVLQVQNLNQRGQLRFA